jgi:CHAT domain-containing protein
LLALGGPDYEASATEPVGGTRSSSGSSCAGFDSLRFSSLPAAAEEAREIAAMWREAANRDTVPQDAVIHLSGHEATETAFKAQAPGRRVLHLATHGFFLDGDCSSGGGTRGLGIVESASPRPRLQVNLPPLLQSGLALAGANRRTAAAASQQDGLLTAEEIASLDLTGVEWAVLSACDTGLGELHAGEGVLGLRRAMQVAGVRALIMSLWPVDDAATRRWMRALYEGRLNQGLDTAQSVRRAGLTVLHERRSSGESTHPFYWSAFVAAGDWR